MKNSFVELNARQKITSLLDKGSEKQLLSGFEEMIPPSLILQNIIPQSDDGISISRGRIKNIEVLIMASEGRFLGGGIGELGGSKILSALTCALNDIKQGTLIYPIFILDSGGVRLQEANYGVLLISEICDLIIAIKNFVPVIGIIPGRVGAYGGAGILSALMSYIIATNKARVGLNGPGVVEEEAGVDEFDSKNNNLVWDTTGAKQRLISGVIDSIVSDTIISIKLALVSAINEKKDSHRCEKFDFYLSLIEKLDLTKKLTISEYNAIFRKNNLIQSVVSPLKISEGQKSTSTSVGYSWFSALTGLVLPSSSVGTVYYSLSKKFCEDVFVTCVVSDAKNLDYRARRGEVGVIEGFRMAKIIQGIYEEDKNKLRKRPVIVLVDAPSQAYGYNEELIGIHIALANSVAAYAKLRQAGHPVIGVIIGNAISGAFLAQGLESNRLIALNSPNINIQAMSKQSASIVTKNSIAEIDKTSRIVASTASDINSYNKLGAIYNYLQDVTNQKTSSKNVTRVIKAINQAIKDVRDKKNSALTNHYLSGKSAQIGRELTLTIYKLMKEEWK